MKVQLIYAVYVLIGFFTITGISCKKSQSGSPAPVTRVAVKAEAGTPDGELIEKKIGKSGGSIETADGRMKLTIPAGAVDDETIFSIQPVTKTLELGSGKSYRLLPANLDFNRDVEISFNYTNEDLDGSASEYLYLAYQDHEGYWHRAVETAIDTTARTLKVKTKHFSDWVVERVISLLVDKGTNLAENEQTTFKAVYEDITPKDDLLAQPESVKPQHVKKWQLFGKGNLDKRNVVSATYTAPSSISQPDLARVEVDLINLLDKENPLRPGTSGEVIVRMFINLVGETFCNWSVKGRNFTGVSNAASVINNKLTISGSNAEGVISIVLSGTTPEVYKSGALDKPDQFVVASNTPTSGYQNYYITCDDAKYKYGDGRLIITRMEAVNGFVEGNFSVTLYEGNDCAAKVAKARGSFKVRRYQ